MSLTQKNTISLLLVNRHGTSLIGLMPSRIIVSFRCLYQRSRASLSPQRALLSLSSLPSYSTYGSRVYTYTSLSSKALRNTFSTSYQYARRLKIVVSTISSLNIRVASVAAYVSPQLSQRSPFMTSQALYLYSSPFLSNLYVNTHLRGNFQHSQLLASNVVLKQPFS